MIKIRQVKDDLPGNRVLHFLRHNGGLLCRRHAQQFMLDASQTRMELMIDERKGGFTMFETTLLRRRYRD